MKKPILQPTGVGNYICPEDPGEPKKNEPRRSVTDEEAAILSQLAIGKEVLEVGTGLGVSTRALAKTAKSVISVDIDPWTHEFDFPDNVELVSEIPNRHFHLAFIDGSHLFEDVLSDLRAADADIFIMHDCYNAGVMKALKAVGLGQVKRFRTHCDMRMFRK